MSRLEKLKNMVKIQSSKGNYDQSEGLANGLILAEAIMEDKEPKYFDSKPTQ